MQKKRSKPKDEVKHEAIEKSAARLFLKQGFSNTSMEMIAADARVTKQTVYSHFKSKDALFSQMILNLNAKHTPMEILLADQDKPIQTLLHEIGMSALSVLTSKEGLAATRLVIAESLHHPELSKAYYKDGTQRMIDQLSQFLAQQHKRGKLVIKDPESASACFFALLKGRYYIRMLLNVPPVPAPREKEQHVNETVDNFLVLYGKK